MTDRDPGFAAVDRGVHADLVAMVDAASRWPATQALRAWEAERLALGSGARLVDVGCGPGDAAFALAEGLGVHGEVVGVELSRAMLAAARTRAPARCRFRAVVGDARALPLADRSCAAARAERTLQWVPDPARAVAELVRVLHPGGRVAVTDTDWSTFAIETGDDRIASAVRTHVGVERRRPSHVGRRLGSLLGDAGAVDLDATAATCVATGWDPDATPGPEGFPPIAGLAADMVRSGDLPPGGAPGFVEAVSAAARAGRLQVTLTAHCVVGRRP